MSQNGSTPQVTSSLDWLNFTYNYPTKGVEYALPKEACFGALYRCGGMHSYTHGMLLECGGKVFYSPDDKRLGVHFQASGSIVTKLLLAYNLDENRLVNDMLNNHWRKCTRFDYAVDFLHRENGYQDIVNEIDEGRGVTRLSRHSIHKDWGVGNGAFCAYLGAPTSDYRVRIYNKAAELNLLWLAWTRFECQVRSDLATAVMKQARDSGVAESIKAMMHKKLRLDSLDWYTEAMRSSTHPVTLPRPDEKFEIWLMDTVLPAIKRRYEGGKNTAIIETFSSQLQGFITRLVEIEQTK